MNKLYRAERRNLHFSDEVFVDAYLLDSGEYRFGITNACLALGLPKDWLYNALKGKSLRRAKLLQGAGFDSNTLKVATEVRSGTKYAETISEDAFSVLVDMAVMERSWEAFAVNQSLKKLALRTHLDDLLVYLEMT